MRCDINSGDDIGSHAPHPLTNLASACRGFPALETHLGRKSWSTYLERSVLEALASLEEVNAHRS
jgi:hypothetical protein